MRKKISIISAAAVIAIICLVAPKFIATQYETSLNGFVSKINESPGYVVQLDMLETGWFGSTAKISLAFNYDEAGIDYAAEVEGFEAELLVTSQYGPLLFSDAGLIGLYAVNVQWLDADLRSVLEWDENTPFYELNLVQGIITGMSFTDAIPAFVGIADEMSFSGYKGEGGWGSELSYEGRIDSFTATDADGAIVTVEDVQLNYYADAEISSIAKVQVYDSDLKVEVAKVSAKDDFNLNDFLLYFGSDVDDSSNTFSVVYGMSVDELLTSEAALSDVSFELVLANLNNQLFDNFQTLLDNANESGQNALAAENFLAFMNDNIDLFLETGPELNLTKLQATVPEGTTKTTINSRIGDVSGEMNVARLFSPFFWLSNAVVDARIEMDELLAQRVGKEFVAIQTGADIDNPSVAQQVNAMLQGLIQQGLIKLAEQKYVSELRLENGETTVNGVAIPLF
ncbi:DUF945 family protein [Marinomonas agarivorans]|nr:DUF945 family protein [Marinomonas agarivorans]